MFIIVLTYGQMSSVNLCSNYHVPLVKLHSRLKQLGIIIQMIRNKMVLCLSEFTGG